MPSKIFKIIFAVFQKAFVICILGNILKVFIFFIASDFGTVAQFYPKEDTI